MLGTIYDGDIQLQASPSHSTYLLSPKSTKSQQKSNSFLPSRNSPYAQRLSTSSFLRLPKIQQDTQANEYQNMIQEPDYLNRNNIQLEPEYGNFRYSKDYSSQDNKSDSIKYSHRHSSIGNGELT